MRSPGCGSYRQRPARSAQDDLEQLVELMKDKRQSRSRLFVLFDNRWAVIGFNPRLFNQIGMAYAKVCRLRSLRASTPLVTPRPCAKQLESRSLRMMSELSFAIDLPSACRHELAALRSLDQPNKAGTVVEVGLRSTGIRCC